MLYLTSGRRTSARRFRSRSRRSRRGREWVRSKRSTLAIPTGGTQTDLLSNLRDGTIGAGYQPIDITISGIWLTYMMHFTGASPTSETAMNIGIIVDGVQTTVPDHSPSSDQSAFLPWMWWEWLPVPATQSSAPDSTVAVNYFWPITRQIKSKRKINSVTERLFLVEDGLAETDGTFDTAWAASVMVLTS